MIAVTTKHSFTFLRPSGFLSQPVTAKELANTSIVRFFLRRLERDEFIEVFVQWRRVAGAAMGGVRRTDPVYVVLIADISEVPHLSFRKKHSHTQGMYGCIPESLIEEAAAAVQPVEVLFVRLGPKEVQITNLEIREELAIIVVSTIVSIKQPI